MGAERVSPAISLGFDLIDAALPAGGLARGAVHEWLGIDDPFEPVDPFSLAEPAPSLAPAAHSATRTPRAPRDTSQWSPPLTMLLHIAHRASLTSANSHNLVSARSVWIGQHVWPYPRAADPRVLACSLFVAAHSVPERVWAADVALRSGAASVVIVDGRGFDMAATRRLQLAAEASGHTSHLRQAALCLLARPAYERTVLSAAATRWRLGWGANWATDSNSSSTPTRRWTVELLRCKGVQPSDTHQGAQAHSMRAHGMKVWCVEQDNATRALRVVAHIPHRSRQAEAAQAAAPLQLLPRLTA